MFALGALATAACWSPPSAPTLLGWTMACLACEAMWVRLPVGGATLSMASCTQFAALELLPPGAAMLVAAVSTAAAEHLFMRKPLRRVLYNAGQVALAVGGAAWALSHVARAAPLSMTTGREWAALALAGVVYFAINSGAVTLAVHVADHVPLRRAWRTNFGNRFEVLSSGALISLGALLADQYRRGGVAAALTVTLPVVLAFLAYREHLARAAPETLERAA